MSKNNEGLRYPSIDNLLTKIDSKYKLAYASARRAKIIKADGYISVDGICSKPVGLALEEIQEGNVEITFEKNQ